MACLSCDDEGWVCETHPVRPWEGLHACSCGGAGMPCGRCNPSTDLDLASWIVPNRLRFAKSALTAYLSAIAVMELRHG
jgi:hypothetical protein